MPWDQWKRNNKERRKQRCAGAGMSQFKLRQDNFGSFGEWCCVRSLLLRLGVPLLFSLSLSLCSSAPVCILLCRFAAYRLSEILTRHSGFENWKSVAAWNFHVGQPAFQRQRWATVVDSGENFLLSFVTAPMIGCLYCTHTL